MKLLLDRGADVNAADNDGQTPLHHASREYEVIDAVTLLLDRGADVNAADNNGDYLCTMHQAQDVFMV